MQKEIVVIIGGPGTGKSTIINGLIAKGYCCYPEISREVILEAKKDGIDIATSQKELLQKIEELTLYIVQQQKEIDALKKQTQK